MAFLDYFNPFVTEIYLPQCLFLIKFWRLFYLKSYCIFRHIGMNCKLRTMRLPCKTCFSRFNVYSYKVSIPVLLPSVTVCYVSVIFFLKQAEREQIV